jgi:hygromycin-B 7''-O-kinase
MPDAKDPILEESEVLRLVHLHLPSAEGVTAVDESGGEARAYLIDAEYVFKTQRPHRVRARTSLEKAAFLERAIGQTSPDLKIPRVLAYGREGNVEYLLESRIPGVTVRNSAISGTKRRDALIELGHCLRRIHDLSTETLEQGGLIPGDANGADVSQRIFDGLDAAAKLAAAQSENWPLRGSLDEIVERLMAFQNKLDLRRAILHSNPGPEHVFVDSGALEFQGVIDFGDAYFSHPGFDLRRWTHREDWLALVEGYAGASGLDDSFALTIRVVLATALISLIGSTSSLRKQAAAKDLSDLLRDVW